jgi:hypothetical protein
MKYPIITAAVVAALAGASHSAHALDVNTTLAAPVQLVAAGASAARDSFLAELHNSVCSSGTLNVYRAVPTALQDFRAYSCTITNGGTPGTVFGSAAGGNATVYYRSEGGSGWGPGSIATGRTIQSLVVDSRCTLNGTIAAGTSTVGVFDCAVSGYVAATDSVTSGLTKRATELGVSDEEPNMYVDANYPGQASSAFPAFSAAVQAQLNSLNRVVGFGQVFGVLVSDSGVTANISTLTQAEIAGIYSGTITDWHSTFNPGVGRNPSAPITVVRRENGSGTQVAAAVQFLGTQNCSPGGALPFVADTGDADTAACTGPTVGNTDGVIERGTTGDLEACIRFNPGAIGPNIFKATPPTGTHYVAINGVSPNKYAAARGDYKYWYEMTLQTGTGLSTADAAAAAGFIGISQRVGSTPTSDSAIALANLFNTPVLPTATTGVPISVARRNGNSCQAAVQQFVP